MGTFFQSYSDKEGIEIDMDSPSHGRIDVVSMALVFDAAVRNTARMLTFPLRLVFPGRTLEICCSSSTLLLPSALLENQKTFESSSARRRDDHISSAGSSAWVRSRCFGRDCDIERRRRRTRERKEKRKQTTHEGRRILKHKVLGPRRNPQGSRRKT